MQTNQEILAEIQADKSSCFDSTLFSIREHQGKLYERLGDGFDGLKYRVIFSADDYDYVEDSDLNEILDTVFAHSSAI